MTAVRCRNGSCTRTKFARSGIWPSIRAHRCLSNASALCDPSMIPLDTDDPTLFEDEEKNAIPRDHR
jgi:hypothetical protein